MSKTKVKRDSHGLYVRGAGYIWRKDFPIGYDHNPDLTAPTKFNEGDLVSISHSGGPLGSVSGEKWFCHGTYLKFGKLGEPIQKGYIPSDDIFRPNYHQWR